MRMNEPASLPTVQVTLRTVSADTVFAALGDPNRRRLLLALRDGAPHTGRSLASAIGTRFDNARKHLEVLARSGLVLAEEDPSDRRRQVYRLAASVKVETTAQGHTMDFGYCVGRV